MINAIISITIITLVVYLINKNSKLKICPICVGVTLTWAWILAGMWFGLLSVDKYEFITAILMGASIGGIVNELKKLFLKLKNKRENKNVELLEDKLKDCC